MNLPIEAIKVVKKYNNISESPQNRCFMTNIRIWGREYQYLCPNTGVKKVGKINYSFLKTPKNRDSKDDLPSRDQNHGV